MNKSISIIAACKNRVDPLKVSLMSWLSFDQVKEVIIVDWSSDEPINYLTKFDSRVKVIRVDNKEYFNQPQPLNLAASIATGDYIFHLDADEYPHEILMEQLHTVIEMNDVDLIWIPRVNTVEGLTDEWANRWGWRVTENGWVNYPDYQSRVFRNIDEIHWQNKVHERIVGTKTYAHLPPQEELSLYHPKTIDKQIQQNKFYEGIV